MKNALIDPNASPVSYISGWTTDTDPQPIYTQIENSCRVAQVEPNGKTFEVAPPLFWAECADDVVTDDWYFNLDDKEIYPKPESPPKPISPLTTL
jgi:hypothetical protein